MSNPTPRRDPASVTRACGTVAERRQLIAAGCSARQIAAALHRGTLLRIRRAWYATPDAPLDTRVAVSLGGRLGSVSAARSYGLWVPDDRAIHVSWPAHGNVARPGRRIPYPGPAIVAGRRIVPHWNQLAPTIPPPSPDAPWRESIEQTLAQVLSTVDRPMAVAIVDSALRLGAIDHATLRFVMARLDSAARALWPCFDHRSDSGLESIVRCWLIDAGLPFLVHPTIDGVGEVDLLVGRSLIVETDGAATHATKEGFFEDRRRDNASARAGFVTARLSSRLVLHDWPACAAQLEEHLRRGDHLRPARAAVLPG